MNLVGSRQGITGSEMKAVDVLGDEREPVSEKLFHGHKCPVAWIGPCRTTDAHAVEVPFPDLIGHLAEHVEGGHLLWLIHLGADCPVSFRTAKGGNAAFRGNSGPGENRDLTASLSYFLQSLPFFCLHGSPVFHDGCSVVFSDERLRLFRKMALVELSQESPVFQDIFQGVVDAFMKRPQYAEAIGSMPAGICGI